MIDIGPRAWWPSALAHDEPVRSGDATPSG
jgi:hypothetical protein